jgi:GNAT superfamily N-acetyltransferase
MSKELPVVRQANAYDAASIARLIHRSHTISFAPFASEAWVGSRDIEEYRSKCQSVFDTAGDNEVTYVAILDDAVVGSVRVAQLQSSEFDAQLVGMHVEPGLTGRGIGSLLMNHVKVFIEEQGFSRVELGVIAANTGTRRFYETHGWLLVRELADGVEGVPVVIYELGPGRYAALADQPAEHSA